MGLMPTIRKAVGKAKLKGRIGRVIAQAAMPRHIAKPEIPPTKPAKATRKFLTEGFIALFLLLEVVISTKKSPLGCNQRATKFPQNSHALRNLL